MSIPKHIQLKISLFIPQYQELKFNNSMEYFEWLKRTSKTEILFKDSGQDLLKFHVAESGEIIDTDIPSLGNIYNGALLLDDPELILSGDTIRIWIPQFNEVSAIKYEVVKVNRKSNDNN
ncbi:hypothetical protein [Flavobacterium geliluteum]|uniref:Uncharacterized protein n=1 Tax=Flavobacterium geliluteum TaxID=2816120 RepID=A0A940X7C0_9FLAO|nr:hypothetical protein [Flavobacterium geliluteum]MBP4139653.1 hypothetical protein [Flavobacterium geliluteum]